MKTIHISKIGVIFTILIFSLVSIGISYSGFTDNIQIQGTITTSDDFNILTGTEETAWARMYDNPNDFTYEFPGANWATYIICRPTENIQTYYLYAGQHYKVGELHVWKDNNHLYVNYDLDENYYSMSESQLHVATSLDAIPQTQSGNPRPGQFDYKEQYDPSVSNYAYLIDWNPNWNNADLYIAAHAVVWGIYS